MRKILFFLAAALMWTGCAEEYDDSAIKGEIDDLKDKVAQLEQQINTLKQEAQKINSDIAAMQAIANGIAITKVTQNADGGYTVTFSNGKSYTIANGQKGDQGATGPQGPEGPASTPMLRIDAEGYWQVSYDGGTTWEYPAGEKISALGQTGATGDQGATGSQGVTPQISVDSEGYWTVSYDGGATWERMKDADGNEVKAVQEGMADQPVYASVFSSVELSEDGSTLKVTLAGSDDVLEIPVGGKALAAIYAGDTVVEGVQYFEPKEQRTYTVVAPTADVVKLLGAPDAWTVALNEMTLDVTAPAAQTRATADSATDISLLVVMKNGLAMVVRMQVAVKEPATPLDAPVVTLNPTKVTEGTEQAVVASWAAVTNAASYKVSFNGAAAVSVTECTYTVAAADVKALAKGSYKVSVVAVPATEANLESAAGEATLTVEAAAAPPTPGTGTVLEWGNSVWKALQEKYGTDETTESPIDCGNGLKFNQGSGKGVKFGGSDPNCRVQLSGSGNATEKCVFLLTVSGPGTLSVDMQASGYKEGETRKMGIAIDGVDTASDGYFADPDARNIYTVDCSKAAANSVVSIYSMKSGINIFNIKWTPKQ